jgi:L-fucose mutarotase
MVEDMLRYQLTHPALLSALAEAGHGSKLLIADGNFAHRTNSYRGAPVIYLNLRPGLVTVDQVLEVVIAATPLERATLFATDDGSIADCEAGYRALLADIPVDKLGRADFYQACQQSDLAAVVATGDQRHFANVLLTVGFNPAP